MFHRYENETFKRNRRYNAEPVNRRHADRTGQLWLQRLKDSGSNKRLNLIYLANGKSLAHDISAIMSMTTIQNSPDLCLLVALLTTCGVVEVAQQSKARRKDDFLIAFSPVIAEATATAYKGATNEVQQKLRRVVEVWRQRQIFELPIQDAIESRIDGTSSCDGTF
jgi:regulator of Ty1 transposition protein 103